MSLTPLPSITDLNGLNDAEVMRTVGILFEPAPVLEKHILSLRPWGSYEAIIELSEKFIEQLFAENRMDDLLSVLNAHPAIGANPKKLSADSKLEQGGAVAQEVLDRLKKLNEEYEKKFGFRFVVFVNGRPKDVILKVLEERMNNDRVDEMKTAASAMMSIARDRLSKRNKSKI